MKPTNNPNIEIYTKNSKERAFSLSSIKLPDGLKKKCVWCLDDLKGLQRRWCKDDECVKAALAWGRPQSPHGLYELLKRQSYCCKSCPVSWKEYMDKAVTKNSKFFGIEDLRSGDIDLVMRRFRRFIPIEIRPEVDHILAISLGGTALGLENHQVLCAKCHKEKTKKDIKEKFAKNGNPRKGVKFSSEHIAALTEARQGMDSDARIKSRQENLYPILRKPITAVHVSSNAEYHFDSLQECAKELNLNSCNISRVINGKQGRTQHKGWTFRYSDDRLKSEVKNEKDNNQDGDQLRDDSNDVTGDKPECSGESSTGE